MTLGLTVGDHIFSLKMFKMPCIILHIALRQLLPSGTDLGWRSRVIPLRVYPECRLATIKAKKQKGVRSW